MNATDITTVRAQVAAAKQQRDKCKAVFDAKNQKCAELEASTPRLDQWGKPVMEGNGIYPQLVKVGSASAIEDAYFELDRAQEVYKEAAVTYDVLNAQLVEVEKPVQPLESLERKMQELVAGDADLYAQLEDQIRALRAMIDEWNQHVAAKVAIRQEIQSRGQRSPDAGMTGKVDPRWSAWFAADFANDEALHRQFDLMAHGQGYLNPLPREFMRAHRQAAQEHEASQRAEAARPAKKGYRRAFLNT